MNKKIKSLSILFIIIFSTFLCAVADNYDDSYLDTSSLVKLIPALPKLRNRKIHVNRATKEPPYYRIILVRDFDIPYKYVKEVALDFKKFPQRIHYIHEFKRLDSLPCPSPTCGTYYAEARASVARAKGIASIDSLHEIPNAKLFLFVSEPKDTSLTAQFNSSNESGFFSIGLKKMNLIATLWSNSPNSCRMGILGEAVVDKTIPAWFMKLALRIVVPRMVRELGDEAQQLQNTDTHPLQSNKPVSK